MSNTYGMVDIIKEEKRLKGDKETYFYYKTGGTTMGIKRKIMDSVIDGVIGFGSLMLGLIAFCILLGMIDGCVN